MKTTLWLAAAIVLGACGGSDGPPVASEDYLHQMNEAYCQQFERCGLASDVEACTATFDTVPMSMALTAAIASGKATFDGAAARACFDAIAAASCEVTAVSSRALPEACLTYFHGSVAEGGTCFVSEECVSQKCAVPSCNMACCPGTCMGDVAPSLATVGESCEVATCDATSYCDQIDRTCMPLKGANATCGSPDECADGLYCLQSGACGSLPEEGQTCGVDGCRRSNDRCSATTQLCTPAGLDGATCANQLDCAALYRCDASKHCSTGAPLDGGCRTSDDCVAGTRCDIADGDTTGLCHALHAVGESCVTDYDCSSHLCNQVDQVCLADIACD